MFLMEIFSSIKEFSYSDLPKTDAFFLTMAVFAIVIPPFLIFFLSPVARRIREIFYLTSLSPTIRFRSVKKYPGDKFEEYKELETEAFKSNPGNFLTLYSGLKMILKLSAEKKSGEKIAEEEGFETVVKILSKSGVLTRAGAKKLKFLQWLSGIVVSGGINSVSQKTLNLGVVAMWRMQKEFNNWLSQETS